MAASRVQHKSQPGLAALARLAHRLGGDRLFLAAARLAYRLRVEGESFIPSSGPCLFACNHESVMSDALVFLMLRRRRPNVHMFAWQNLRGEHPMLDFLTRFGEPGLDRRYLRAYWLRGLSAGELLRARSALLDGAAIIVTAEGEWTWDGRLQYPLAPGTAWLALRTAAPVIPVVSSGGYDVQPRWQLDKLRWTGRISIRVGPPLHLSDAPQAQVNNDALQAANERLWQAMAALARPGATSRPTTP